MVKIIGILVVFGCVFGGFILSGGKFMALVRELRGRGWFATRAEPRLIDLLDLVALGTVADVAQLRGLNRAFVAQGGRMAEMRSAATCNTRSPAA